MQRVIEAPRKPSTLFRALGILGHDVVITLVGFYLAAGWASMPVGPLGQLAAALVAIRVAAALVVGLHRWSFSGSGYLDALRLVAATLVGTVAFELLQPGLPLPVYLLEFFATTSLMALFRFAPRLADEIFRSNLPWSPGTTLTSERPRRILNVLVAAVGLFISLPVMVIIAIAIKLTSRGPVIYTQERIGLDIRGTRPTSSDPRRKVDLGGRPFLMYKFRTMCVDAESGTGAVWCSKKDPRVTPIGEFLRHCRLDELPQLVNVLKGDMNVVGPRPERPTLFANLREQLPRYSMRQRARPGITGYAQVNLEYDASIEDVGRKLEYDLEYLTRQSVLTDLYIMAMTIPVMLFRDKMLSVKRQADRRSELGAGSQSAERTAT